MLNIPQLNDLVGDGMVFAAKHTLVEVFAHLESRDIRFHEILTAVADITREKGYEQAAWDLENISTNIRPELTCKEMNESNTL